MGFKGSFVGGISYLQFNNAKYSAYRAIAQGIGIGNNASMNPQSEIATQNQDGEVSYYIIKSDVCSWIMKGFESGFRYLPSISDKISFLLAAVKIFGELGYIRKQGFFLHYLGQILKEDFYSVCLKNNININPLRFGSSISYRSIVKVKDNHSPNYPLYSYSSHISNLPPHKEIDIDDNHSEDMSDRIEEPIALPVETMEPEELEESSVEGMNNLPDYSDFKDISFRSVSSPHPNGNNSLTDINILEALKEDEDEDEDQNINNNYNKNNSKKKYNKSYNKNYNNKDYNDNYSDDNNDENYQSVDSMHSKVNSVHTNITNNTVNTNTSTMATTTTAVNTTQMSNTLPPLITNLSALHQMNQSTSDVTVSAIYKFPLSNIIDIMKMACHFYGVGINGKV